ncbi:MAG: hypothetical protein AAGC78_00775 [Cellvibrio sp.]|uniref:hypothetical protein n=1 Tax=Cellvibrio sp. TaxID=1965322 RepID=UPI0031A6625A
MLKNWVRGRLFGSLCVVCALAISSHSYARELVIAFENTLQPSTSLDAMARSQMLVRNLATAGVPQAMFLIKTKGIDQKDEARIAVYSDKGHLLVNAGHGHSLVTKSDLYVYEIGILKANRILENYAGYKKHVHFSYLHEAGDVNIQRGLAEFLQERGYHPAFTGFNSWRGADQYLDQLYQKKIRSNRHVDMAVLEKTYVDFILQSLAQQDATAFNLLGYSPRQVLVLQETDLAAYFIVALVDRLVEQGWTIIAAERALDDPVANPINANGWGANGYVNSITRLRDEPVAYPRVLGERKAAVDTFLQARIPGLLE